jgi:hypothetical protein
MTDNSISVIPFPVIRAVAKSRGWNYTSFHGDKYISFLVFQAQSGRFFKIDTIYNEFEQPKRFMTDQEKINRNTSDTTLKEIRSIIAMTADSVS